MADLRGHNLSVRLPAGWDGRISVRRDGAPEPLHAASGTHVFSAKAEPVIHLANFGLPEERGDFGSGAVELMGDNDVFIVLFEYETAATGTPLFAARGLPRALDPDDFSTSMLRRGIAGQAGYQTFFQEAGRAFCLYVVLGSSARRRRLVALVSSVLASVRITARAPG